MALFGSSGRSKIGIFDQVIVSTSWTRPADTTTYTSGDIIEDSTSAPTTFSISGCANGNGRSGRIIEARLIDEAYTSALLLNADLFIFDTTFTANNDNAGFAPSNAVLETCRGVIGFSSGLVKVGNPAAGASGNVIFPGTIAAGTIGFTCGASSTSLFLALVARNAYVPVSAEKFVVSLTIEQY